MRNILVLVRIQSRAFFCTCCVELFGTTICYLLVFYVSFLPHKTIPTTLTISYIGNASTPTFVFSSWSSWLIKTIPNLVLTTPFGLPDLPVRHRTFVVNKKPSQFDINRLRLACQKLFAVLAPLSPSGA